MEYRRALKRPPKGLAFAFFSFYAVMRLLVVALTTGGARWAAAGFAFFWLFVGVLAEWAIARGPRLLVLAGDEVDLCKRGGEVAKSVKGADLILAASLRSDCFELRYRVPPRKAPIYAKFVDDDVARVREVFAAAGVEIGIQGVDQRAYETATEPALYEARSIVVRPGAVRLRKRWIAAGDLVLVRNVANGRYELVAATADRRELVTFADRDDDRVRAAFAAAGVAFGYGMVPTP